MSNEISVSEIPVSQGKIGAVMVVGAGVGGIQAALDAAAAGFKVYLVDKGPAIGGKMAQLDKTFPTNDCSMCILSPKFIECASNPNITIITNTHVESLEGEAGNFQVQLYEEPRYVDEEKCTGCGTCAEYCPIYVPDVYNEGLAKKKCIHVHFPQAVPAVSMVDAAHCLFLQRKICQICVPTCKSKAINFKMQPKRTTVEVGSVILAPGYEIFDAYSQSQYGYHRFSNVVTSLEFERIISASGPNGGEILRPSDNRTPHKIAWIQCVGSRDETSNCTYCSAVCCMYATKQVILSKEHHPEIEAVVLHNDIRAYGKGFERFYERAKNMPGVRYQWAKTSIVGENQDNKNITLRYRVNGSKVKDEEFDLVVLSVGLNSTAGNKELAEKLSIGLNEHGFCESPAFSPMETSRDGIYSCGVFHAPMDIPDAVTMASGAASLASQLLFEERGTLMEEKVYPEERDTTGEAPRVGIFVCDCGTNIAKVVDVPQVVEYAKGLPGVSHSVEETFACSVDAVNHMAETIRKQGLNRVVVAACTPRTHEPVFQAALREAGLNPFLFQFANIREQCSFVHMNEKEVATEKAKDLIRMAASKALLLQPLHRAIYNVTPEALVIGGGIAGMTSSLALANQGIKVHLIEKTESLGGLSKRIPVTLEGADVQSMIKKLVDEVYASNLIEISTNAELVEYSGYVGNFISGIRIGNGEALKEVEHGITIVAAGAEELKPNEYLYGEDDRVMTLLELDEKIEKDSDRVKECDSAVFIQCVGSRNDERQYCSRVCCSHSVKNALQLKKLKPEMDVYVLYRDMRTYGFKEDYYKEASDQGVIFIRYQPEDPPDIHSITENGKSFLRLTATEPILGQRLEIDADLVCLASASVPPAGNKPLSQMLKVPLNEDGFFLEAHMKLRPVDFSTDGIFMCGTAHSPKFIDESIAQAQAAASKALAVLTRTSIEGQAAVAEVREELCSGCRVCEMACPYGAVKKDEEKRVSVVNQALCKGCGTCVAACPSGAMNGKHFTMDQILAEIRAAFAA
ncbi:MAG: CoB--CoM heterodisulfide reductase iron-sulfur subunit A family protein [Proteobacteria bacterium]|nr:CoB--CoM heterodisulfide reductase iron-sulfur subunit A family protein [Pseudomonadota bacterium]